MLAKLKKNKSFTKGLVKLKKNENHKKLYFLIKVLKKV